MPKTSPRWPISGAGSFPTIRCATSRASSCARKRAVEDDLFLVAEFEGRIAGAAIAGYDGYRGYIWIIFVQSYLLRAFEAAQYFPFALLLMLLPVLRVARAWRQRRAGSKEADPRGSLGAADDVEAFAAKRRTREPGIRGG